MEIGIDSFAAANPHPTDNIPHANMQSLHELIERMVHADQVGLDFFGIGEHHRKEFLDSRRHSSLQPPPPGQRASASGVQ